MFVPALTPSQIFVDFSEGGPTLIAELDPKGYAPTELAQALQDAMNLAGNLIYSVAFNRVTNKITIAANGIFQLRISSGPHSGAGIFPILSFDQNSDLTGANNYTGSGSCGEAYFPQFFLLDYISTDHRQEAVEANVNVTASGEVEVVKYGTQKFMECSIEFINDYSWDSTSMIEENKTGVSDAIKFLQYIIKKDHVEFMPDRDDLLTYETLLIESTSENSKGIGYRLDEDLSMGAGFYKTGKLVFRKVE